MHAVINIKGNQYLVTEGQELLVNCLDTKDSEINISDVLLAFDNDKFILGTPTLSNCTVKAINLGEFKGDKLRVSKYKAKSRYRRTVGFRSLHNRIRIEKIAIK